MSGSQESSRPQPTAAQREPENIAVQLLSVGERTASCPMLMRRGDTLPASRPMQKQQMEEEDLLLSSLLLTQHMGSAGGGGGWPDGDGSQLVGSHLPRECGNATNSHLSSNSSAAAAAAQAWLHRQTSLGSRRKNLQGADPAARLWPQQQQGGQCSAAGRASDEWRMQRREMLECEEHRSSDEQGVQSPSLPSPLPATLLEGRSSLLRRVLDSNMSTGDGLDPSTSAADANQKRPSRFVVAPNKSVPRYFVAYCLINEMKLLC